MCGVRGEGRGGGFWIKMHDLRPSSGFNIPNLEMVKSKGRNLGIIYKGNYYLISELHIIIEMIFLINKKSEKKFFCFHK